MSKTQTMDIKKEDQKRAEKTVQILIERGKGQALAVAGELLANRFPGMADAIRSAWAEAEAIEAEAQNIATK